MNKNFGWFIAFILLGYGLLMGCSQENGSELFQDTDNGGEDSDGSADGDTDSDTDGDCDSDTEGEIDSDTEGEIDSDTEGEIDSDTDGHTDSNTSSDTEVILSCPSDDGYEENDSLETAVTIQAAQILHGIVCPNDSDYFRANLQAGDEIQIDVLFAHGDGDIDAAVFDPSGNQIAESVSGDDNEHLSVTASVSGDYRIHIYGYDGRSNIYDLVLDIGMDTDSDVNPDTDSDTSDVETGWRFVAVGDSRGNDNGVNTHIFEEIVQEVYNAAPEFVVYTGDLVNGSSSYSSFVSELTTWLNAAKPLYDAGIFVYSVRGNHEDRGPGSAWDDVFSGNYALPNNGPLGEENKTFSVHHENALILGFDQYINSHRINQPWMNQQLAAISATHIFAFAHEPAFAADHTDCMDDYLAARNTFWETFVDAGGRAYFTGHDHFYDHARIDDGDGNPDNDAHQFIVGTAGAPKYSYGSYSGNNSYFTPINMHYASEYGYMIVHIDGPVATLTWMERISAGNYQARDVWSYSVN